MIITKPVILGLLSIQVVNGSYGREWLDSVAKYLGYAEENNIELTDESFLNFVKNKSASSFNESNEAEIVKTIELHSTVTVTQIALTTSQTKTSTIGSKISSFPSKLVINGDVLLHNKLKVDEMKLNSTKFKNNTTSSIIRFGSSRKLLQVDSTMLVSRVSDIPNLYTNSYHKPYTSDKTPLSMPKINGSNIGSNHNSSIIPIPQYRPDSRPDRNPVPNERVYTIDYMNVGSLARVKYSISILFTIINLFF